MEPRQDRSLALDGLRGVAAAAVVLFHGGLSAEAPWLMGHGGLAVDVFFAMSGFVVAGAYGERLRQGWGIARFARVRVARLYPLYLAGTLLGLAVWALAGWDGSAEGRDAMALSLLLAFVLVPLPAGGTAQIFPLNPPSWSLFVEALLNAGYGLGACRLGPRRLALAATLAAALLVAAAAADRPLLYGGSSGTLGVDAARGAFGFAAGLLLARCAGTAWWDAVPRWPTPLVLAALSAALALPPGAFGPGFDLAAVLLLSPAVVAAAARSQPSPRVGRLCRYAGALSYPLYAVHAPVLKAVDLLARRSPGHPPPSLAAMLCAAALSLALAAAVARWLEPALARPFGGRRRPSGTTRDVDALTPSGGPAGR